MWRKTGRAYVRVRAPGARDLGSNGTGSLGQKAHRVSPIYVGATCRSEELGRLKKKKNAWVSSGFSYRVFTGPFSYFKLANS